MKVYRDLRLTGNRTELERIIATMSAALPDGWRRDGAVEQQLHGDLVAFACEATARHPAATLFLARIGDDTLEVANVLPSEAKDLSYDAYNQIVEDFDTRIVEPAVKGLNVRVELGKTETDLEDYMSPNAAQKLRQFSVSANKSTGSAHPRDQERWHAFIIVAHREHASLDASTLREWLIEHGGWDADRASDLAIEYDMGRALLQQYDR